jgi:DNA-binding NtrC family response regulator
MAPADLVGQSAAIVQLRQRVEALATAADGAILVVGEAGTGKELVARCLHDRSARRDSPLVVVNCAALTESQLEAALFGHEPGAFADAPRGRDGVLAGTGTVFLDEVAELPLHLQSRLARVLADGVWRRVGGVQERPVRCRLIASSRRDLAEVVASGAFRVDLLQRLATITLRLPPLRERSDDVPLLAHYFLDHFGRQMGKALAGFGEEALETLGERDWPGNVRELRNAVELAAIHCERGLIQEQHLPHWEGVSPGINDVIPREMVELPTGDRSLRSVEKIMVGRVLDETRWNISRAAALLGINRTTLYNKIKLYELGARP